MIDWQKRKNYFREKLSESIVYEKYHHYPRKLRGTH